MNNTNSGIGKFTGDVQNPMRPLPGWFVIPDGTITADMLTSVPVEKLVGGDMSPSATIAIGALRLSGASGFYGSVMAEEGETFPFAFYPDGSGKLGNGIEWTADGLLTVAAAKVLGELEAATISADKILSSSIYATLAMFGTLYAGTETQEQVAIDANGISLYNSLHNKTGWLKTDGTGWLGGENEFAWNDNGVLIWRLTTGYLQSDVSPNPRIVIDHDEIAGYSDATTKQFYLQASDGKAYFGAGAAVLDTTGATLDTVPVIFKQGNSGEVGRIFGGLYTIGGNYPSLKVQGPSDDLYMSMWSHYAQGETSYNLSLLCYGMFVGLYTNWNGVDTLTEHVRFIPSSNANTSELQGYDGASPTMTQTWEIDNKTGKITTVNQFVSSLATGTKPIDVTSTTVCTNLNADQVDGRHAAAILPLAAFGTSKTDYDCASSGAFEDDTALDVTITTTVTCTLRVMLIAKIYGSTTRMTAWRLGLILDGETTGGQTENNAIPVGGSTIMGMTTYHFTNVAAGEHTIEPQIYRVESGDTISVRERFISIEAIPE